MRLCVPPNIKLFSNINMTIGRKKLIRERQHSTLLLTLSADLDFEGAFQSLVT